MFDMPFWLIKVIGGVGIIAAAVFGLWYYGHHQYRLGVEDQIAVQKATAQKAHIAGIVVTSQVVLNYQAAQTKIEESFRPIVGRVSLYVTEEDNRQCVIHNGFVSLWNGANKMQLSIPTGAIDDKASRVSLYDVATEHANEAEYTHKLEAQLEALQEWVRKEQVVYSSK